MTCFGQRHDDAPGLLELTVSTDIGHLPPDDILSVMQWLALTDAGIMNLKDTATFGGIAHGGSRTFVVVFW